MKSQNIMSFLIILLPIISLAQNVDSLKREARLDSLREIYLAALPETEEQFEAVYQLVWRLKDAQQPDSLRYYAYKGVWLSHLLDKLTCKDANRTATFLQQLGLPYVYSGKYDSAEYYSPTRQDL